MKITVAADIGNSETKMIARYEGMEGSECFHQPSVIRKLIKSPQIAETNLKKNVINLDENLIVHITSNALKTHSDGLYVIGKKAMQTDMNKVQNMNIKLGNKHKHDIPVIMILSMIARKIVKDEFELKGSLDSSYQIDCDFASAIPASEFTFEKAKEFEKRLASGDHTVVVHLGDKRVMVGINFKRTKITQEGVPAIFAMVADGEDNDQRKVGLFDKFNEVYSEEMKPKDLLKMKIFHVDIGDGTTEYIYTNGVNPVIDACDGERRGVGHATEDAVIMLNEILQGSFKTSRQSFMEIIKDESHNLHSEAFNALEAAKGTQANEILEDTFEKIQNKAGNTVDLIAVYGGGSIQFREYLEESLREYAETINSKLLWVPKELAVNLNVRGLDILNRTVFSKNKK
ncbi:ParM/StbA family protein [Bacillus stratosphericus]|uniref:ParM/StbA family protein n=1 Tax=Bacillus stratosphericus TaxID=293386 RepID=UPI001CFA6B7B|nr:ParM/StbA family protein [Bacillus stratosphericus]